MQPLGDGDDETPPGAAPEGAPTLPPTLHKTLTWIDLTLIGVGGIIGAGIYVLTGQAAARYAGPAISVSFLIAAFSCFFSALCYSELASIIPSAGSAYSFGTASLGPFIGFLLGWDLMLEYLFGAATVAVGWAGYFSSFLRDVGLPLPRALTSAPYARDHAGNWVPTGGVVNLPAALIVAAVTLLQIRGIKESARFNNAVVALKVGVLLLFLCAGFGFVRSSYYTPFIPDAQGPGEFGVGGILRGSSVVFFSCACAPCTHTTRTFFPLTPPFFALPTPAQTLALTPFPPRRPRP